MAGPYIDPKAAADMQKGATEAGPGGQAIVNAGKSLYRMLTGASDPDSDGDTHCPTCGQPKQDSTGQ